MTQLEVGSVLKTETAFDKDMNSLEMKATRTLAKRAREQRNASTNDQDFDYWHGIMEQYENKLKTGENK